MSKCMIYHKKRDVIGWQEKDDLIIKPACARTKA